ncbi:LuxR C-terminal-related transcriptional regulator [Gordonia sp. CPCC 205515]|uniref:LuxR C-terminal-related transcriptional regulator n=1 Tax=Gordonia sp. CPCC 205515 TaxID=3140791 RepID=UPI003AF3DCC0
MENKFAHVVHRGRPALPPGFIRRRRVDDALTRGADGPVTVVCAGPGYGKTLAVAGWADRADDDRSVVWIVADSSATTRTFWSSVLGALAPDTALPPDHPLRELAPSGEFGAIEVRRIIDGLWDLTRPLTVVIDDFHLFDNSELLDSIDGFIEHRPAGVSLIAISRTQPALRLGRLRMSGDLTEIDAGLLAFTRDEIAEFCTKSGVAVAPDDLDLIEERTEGWPAGLRLLLLGIDDDDLRDGLRRLGGQQRPVAAYLLEEVLERISPSDRRFLLTSSVVDPVCGDLARALTGRPDSWRVLDDLVATNSLTVRLSDRPDWYRYHPLLRELLQDRLRAESPDSAAELHRKAAEWFIDSGDAIGALVHLASAGDWDRMLRMLAFTALPMILSPRAPELAAALIPAEAHNARHPTAATLLITAIAEFHRHDFTAMDRCARDAEALLESADAADTTAARVVIALIRMVRSRVSGLAELVDCCAAVSQLIDGLPRQSVPAAAGLLLMAENNRAIGLVHRGDLTLAEPELEKVRQRAESVGMSLMSLAATSYLAVVDMIHGRLPDVARRVDEILDLAARRGWSREPQIMVLYAAAAWMHFERNELDEASERIAQGRSAGVAHSDAGAWLMMEVVAVRVAAVRRDSYAAHAAGSALMALIDQNRTLPPLLDAWARVALAEVEMLDGRIPEIPPPEDDDPSGSASGVLRVLRARVSLAAGRPAEVLEILGASSRFAPYRVLSIKAALLSAVAAHQLRRDALAIERIDEAVRLAAPVGAVRAFLVGGPAVPTLLTRRQHVSDSDREFVAKVLAACGDPLPELSADQPVVDDLLTERELVVLRYLPTMYKAAEIAADLFVSVNTVKTHQQSIYRKLGVSTRREAVDRARERKLL